MVNKARGEVEVSIGVHKLILCAEMERLAAVSAELGSIAFFEIAKRVHEQEPQAVLACLKHMDITDTFKTLERVKFVDVIPITAKIVIALAGGEDQAESKTKK